MNTMFGREGGVRESGAPDAEPRATAGVHPPAERARAATVDPRRRTILLWLVMMAKG
jgi:hypothetical protein